MYKFRRDQVLDPEFLTKLVERFKKEYVPRFIRDQQYYEVKTEILKRTMTDGKPNNRLAHGFCRYITNMATSYFAGKPLGYIVEDNEYQEALENLFQRNYIDSLNFAVSKEASKKGIGFLLMFLNEKGDLRIKKMDAETIIPVYSSSLDEFWRRRFISGKITTLTIRCCVSMRMCMMIRLFTISSGKWCKNYTPMPENPKEAHLMGDIPVIVFWNNEEQQGDYEPHTSLVDAYDKAQSDTGNDMEYFTDAYLWIKGASEIVEAALTGEDGEGDGARAVRDFRKNKLLMLDENGQAGWLVKNVNDTATENYKNRLYKDIFFLAQVPALSDESFAGNLSGIAIKYKLIGVEELALMKENCFRSAQTKLIRMLTEYLNTKMNKDWNPDSVEQKYERNFIDNDADIISNARQVEGIVSHETQLGMLPGSIVDDAQEELLRIRQEAADEEQIPMAVV